MIYRLEEVLWQLGKSGLMEEIERKFLLCSLVTEEGWKQMGFWGGGIYMLFVEWPDRKCVVVRG